MRERVGHEENEGQRGRVEKGAGEDIQGVALTHSHPSSFLAHTHTHTPQSPYRDPCFIFTFWALDNAVTAYRVPALYFDTRK